MIVGVGGNRTRYQADRYDSIWNKRTFVNLSGTAIIIRFITVSNALGERIWDVFFRKQRKTTHLLLLQAQNKNNAAKRQKWRKDYEEKSISSNDDRSNDGRRFERLWR